MKPNPPRYSIRSILIDNSNWERYKLNHSVDQYIVKEIKKMLDCCNPNKGFFIGYCKHCDKEIIMHVRCNSKVCSRCGRSYVDKWVDKARNKLFKEQHRLVTLTIPADLRPILEGRWDLLKILQDSAHEALVIVASKTLKRNRVKIGLLVGLQTYGQDMKFHPHLHCMVSEKTRYKQGFIDLKFIPKELLRKTWRNVIVKNLCKAQISHEDKCLIQYMLDKYPNGFVTDVGNRSMNRKEVIRYLARYMRHPAIANSRILFYGREKVVIRMKDKLKREYSTWFCVEEFIERLIMHIAPKHFRIVRWYGLYSRRSVRLERKESEKREIITRICVEKKKIFRCPECKNVLDSVIFFIDKPPDARKLMNKLDYWIELAN